MQSHRMSGTSAIDWMKDSLPNDLLVLCIECDAKLSATLFSTSAYLY